MSGRALRPVLLQTNLPARRCCPRSHLVERRVALAVELVALERRLGDRFEVKVSGRIDTILAALEAEGVVVATLRRECA